MSAGVYHIQTQADAQVELERQRLMRQVRDAQRTERASENKRDSRARKCKAIDDNSSGIEASRNADRMARMREAQRAKNLERSVEERADILNKIQHRYYFLQY